MNEDKNKRLAEPIGMVYGKGCRNDIGRYEEWWDDHTVDLILDDTGKLRDAAIEFLEGRNEDYKKMA